MLLCFICINNLQLLDYTSCLFCPPFSRRSMYTPALFKWPLIIPEGGSGALHLSFSSCEGGPHFWLCPSELMLIYFTNFPKCMKKYIQFNPIFKLSFKKKPRIGQHFSNKLSYPLLFYSCCFKAVCLSFFCRIQKKIF